MIGISEEIVREAVERTKLLGAEDHIQTIYLLEKEIREYRDKLERYKLYEAQEKAAENEVAELLQTDVSKKELTIIINMG